MFKQVRLNDAILKFYQRSQPIAFSNAETLYDDLVLLRDQILMYGDLSEAQTNYLNNFIEKFDTTLSVTVRDIFEKWLSDGFLVDLIRDIINEEVIEARDGEARLNIRLNRDKQAINNEITQLKEKDNDLTAQLAQTEKVISVKAFGAVGDGLTDDIVAFENARDYAVTHGYKLWVPTGSYLISRPFEIVSFLRIFGERNSSIYKDSDAVDSKGVNAVITGHSVARFSITGLNVTGNRQKIVDHKTVTMDGIYLTGCSYFELDTIGSYQVRHGFSLRTNWVATYRLLTASRTQSYGFNVTGANTSSTFINPTNWGTGGGFNFEGVYYSTIISGANDHISMGGNPSDPFGIKGSGGDYLNPNPVIRAVGSTIHIVSMGVENSNSPLIACEGSSVIFDNLTIFGISVFSETFRFINVAGTGESNILFNNVRLELLKILLPTPAYTRTFVSVEDSGMQRVIFSRLPTEINNEGTFGNFKYPANRYGVQFKDSIILINQNQSNMIVGGQSTFISSTGSVEIEVQEGVKYMVFKSPETPGANETFDIPLIKKSTLNTTYEVLNVRLFVKGVLLTQYGREKYEIIKTVEGVESVAETLPITRSGDLINGFAYNKEKLPFVEGGKPVSYKFRITKRHSTDTLKFSDLYLEQF